MKFWRFDVGILNVLSLEKYFYRKNKDIFSKKPQSRPNQAFHIPQRQQIRNQSKKWNFFAYLSSLSYVPSASLQKPLWSWIHFTPTSLPLKEVGIFFIFEISKVHIHWELRRFQIDDLIICILYTKLQYLLFNHNVRR